MISKYENMSREALADEASNLEGLLGTLHDRMSAVEDRAKRDARPLSEREEAKLSSMSSEFEATEAKLEAVKTEIENSRPIRRTEPQMPRSTSLRRHDGMVAEPIRTRPGATPFNRLFPKEAANSGGFADLRDFIRPIAYGQMDPRLVKGAHIEGEGSAGGFFVPTQLLGRILDASLESEVVRPRAMTVPMSTANVAVPHFGFTDRSSGLHGFATEWLGEAAQGTIQTGDVRKIALSAKKAAVFSKASSELLEDGPLFQAAFEPALVAEVSFALDTAFLWGTGAGQPLGAFVSAAKVAVAKEAGQAADTITYPNVANMFSRMTPASINRAVWVCHPMCVPQLYQLQSIVTNVAGSENVGGGLVPVFTYSNGQYRLLGLPLVVSEKMKVLGDEGDIGLADFNAYMIGLRRVATFERSVSAGWTTDEIHFRLITRVDGQPAIDEPITLPDGNTTVSPFVTLAART